MNQEMKQLSPLLTEYDLNQARTAGSSRQPAMHQAIALAALSKWYNSRETTKGGILVLPTGGGKTSTAIHFTCHEALSQGAKVLWLAHTHHLLEQAFESFEKGVGLIHEPRVALRVRVVSGQGGDHFPIHTIKALDDVVICSLATACRAYEQQHPALQAFLRSSDGNLLVIFDEAHHAPARTYRELMRNLRIQFPGMKSLGLTATPTHNEERKRGWLLELFPQGIIHQVTANELMQQGILAKPLTKEIRTEIDAESISPSITERDMKKWLATNADVPEHIVEALATKRERNDLIVQTYCDNKDQWGKTLVFADRWHQCEYLREALSRRGVRVDVVYSHVGDKGKTADERNRRTSDENNRALRAFKNDELDVLINVKMLTEGTDVPNVKTVFLTRQTTSRILLTQMIGRALRGPRFGGTEEANIVFFYDDWKHRIDWARIDVLVPGPLEEELKSLRKHPPLDLISIELIRRLARQMDNGENQNLLPFTNYLPIGWYVADVMLREPNSDEDLPIRHMVMVFEKTQASIKNLLESLKQRDLSLFEEYDVSVASVAEKLDQWRSEFFSEVEAFVVGDLTRDIYFLACHLAQNDRHSPMFVPFDLHKSHDLDQVARSCHDSNVGMRELSNILRKEYDRKDRYWTIFYPNFVQFKCHFDACVNRLDHSIEEIKTKSGRLLEATPDREPSEEMKLAVKKRDGKKCLCCGTTRRLQIDHIDSFYMSGSNEENNLQTLCKTCNEVKSTIKMDFRFSKLLIKTPQQSFPMITLPVSVDIRSIEAWETHVRGCVNLYYRCQAVDTVEIGLRGDRFYHWRISLHDQIKAELIKPHLAYWAEQIREHRKSFGLTPSPDTIEVFNI